MKREQCGHEQGVSSLHNAVFAHHLLTESLHAAVSTIVDTRETLKVLLVTDIGRDLDDALALLALLPAHRSGECQLVGVVACGGHSKARAAIARGASPVAQLRSPPFPHCVSSVALPFHTASAP